MPRPSRKLAAEIITGNAKYLMGTVCFPKQIMNADVWLIHHVCNRARERQRETDTDRQTERERGRERERKRERESEGGREGLADTDINVDM